MNGCDGVFDHNHHTKALVGIYENKVVISSDSGITWQTVAQCSCDLNDVCVDHINNIYYAVGGNRLFKISKGKVCDITQNMPKNQFGRREPHGITIDKRYTKVIYVTGGGNDYMNDSCTMRSVNGGESFEVLTRNKRNSFVTEGYGLGWEADAIACRADNGVVYVPGSCFGFATIDAYEE